MGMLGADRTEFSFGEDNGGSETDEAEPECDVDQMLDFCNEVAKRLPSAFTSCFTTIFSLVSGNDNPAQLVKMCSLLTATGQLFSSAPLAKLRGLVRRLGPFCASGEAGLARSATSAIAALGSTQLAADGTPLHPDVTELIDGYIEDLAQSLTSGLSDPEASAPPRKSPPKTSKSPKGSSKKKQAANAAADPVAGRLDALSVIARSHPAAFEPHIDDIQTFVVREVLGIRNSKRASEQSSAAQQFSARAKVAGLHVLSAQLLGLTECAESHAAAATVWKLLTKVIRKNGDISASADADESTCNDIVVAAADCILEILSVQRPNYEKTVDREEALSALSLVAQNPDSQVRRRLCASLFSAISSNKPQFVGYYTLFAILGDFVQDKDTQALAKSRLKWVVQTRRGMLSRSRMSGSDKSAHMPEMGLPYLVHLLAHSPDIEDEYKNQYKGVIRVFELYFTFGHAARALDSTYGNYMLNVLHHIQRAATDATCDDDTGILQSIAEAGSHVLRAKMAVSDYTRKFQSN